MCVGCQADAPAVGWVEVNTLPAESTAAQNETDGHDSPDRGAWHGTTQNSKEQLAGV
jgi:hypothetical protein